MAYPEDAHVLAIWLRLQAWSPDLAGAAFPFSARLAAENGWSAAHTQRVIQEYRRFALLAVISPQTMTPSDAVDQAWHLHLTCTRAYWEDFCPRVLGAPLDLDSATIQAGFDFALKPNTVLTIGYDGTYGSRTQANALRGGFAWRF